MKLFLFVISIPVEEKIREYCPLGYDATQPV
jgi:hypothetical protein